jgi:hypothetical protein
VSTHAHDVLAPDPPRAPIVHVTCDPHGGWQVDALLDGRIIASRHCSDWHRVERARRALAQARPLEPAPRRTLALAGRR